MLSQSGRLDVTRILPLAVHLSRAAYWGGSIVQRCT